ncbi:MAG TPA: hypothetical protein VFT29_05550 [Gemmatimonadaceae bacterium]|nr:hypothetical protein [Gemmatimonadaceae bacterium]
MPPVVPPKVPAITRDQATAFLVEAGLPAVDKAVLLGRRGFFVDMGAPGNDFGIYDDGIVLVSPTAFITYNANTDPSVKRPRVAILQPGRWTYQPGIHNRSKPVDRQYRALIQAGEVTVFRPDTEATPAGTNDASLGRCLGGGKWRGWFGANIHRGGLNTTGSEGCQTIYKPQWDAFLAQAEMEMKRYNQKTIEYFLTTEFD